MRLHMLGIPHTRTTSAFSHCAFTGKVRRWAQMMAPLGYECLHYGVGAPDSPGWNEHVEVMSPARQNELAGFDIAYPPPAKFVGDLANVGHALYQEFNERLEALLRANVRPGDVICLPFGHGHQRAVRTMYDQCIETGIGYPTALVGYRIYESSAWMHWHIGRENRGPWDSEWVVPNYFDVAEWPLRRTAPRQGEFVLYFGRLTPIKGLWEIVEIAKRLPDLRFVLCGQGDPAPFLAAAPNIEYHRPVHGMDRAALMHRAICLLMPTRYVEPFGGVAVEAGLTGTPCLTSNHSAFRETMPETLRCNHLGEWVEKIYRVMAWDRGETYELHASMRERYSLGTCAVQYDRIFGQAARMRREGWYA